MLMAYLPKEKIVIEADLFDTDAPAPPTPTAANRSFYNHVQTTGARCRDASRRSMGGRFRGGIS